MPILNYTTKIEATKTIGEIQQALVTAGANDVTVSYKDKIPSALTFTYTVGMVEVLFRLPVNIGAVHKILNDDPKVVNGYRTWAQAQRVAWRVIRSWVKAQLAYIETGQATLPQLFFPHSLDSEGNRTLYESFADQMALPPVVMDAIEKVYEEQAGTAENRDE